MGCKAAPWRYCLSGLQNYTLAMASHSEHHLEEDASRDFSSTVQYCFLPALHTRSSHVTAGLCLRNASALQQGTGKLKKAIAQLFAQSESDE